MFSKTKLRVPFAGFLRVAGLLAVLAAAACATPPPASDPEALAEFRELNDPLEPANRVIYVFDDKLDEFILRPVAIAYGAVLPEAVRDGVHNALFNLGAPVRFTNDMLDGKPRRAGDTAMRFLINSTVGIAGLFDVAEKCGYPDHDADVGLTLALWGVPPGPYLYLPLLGPSDVRDTVGYAINVGADPFIWVGQGSAVVALRWSRVAVREIDWRQRHGADLDKTKSTALDPYATFRSLYRQFRRSELDKIRQDQRATVPVWFAQPAAGTSR